MAWTTSAGPRETIVSRDRDQGEHQKSLAQDAAALVQVVRQHSNALVMLHLAMIAIALMVADASWPVIMLGLTSAGLAVLVVLRTHETESSWTPEQDHVCFSELSQPQIHTTRAHASNPLQEGDHWNDVIQRVCHELRTPLNAVIGFSDLMRDETFGPLGSPRYQEYVRHIRDSGDALLKSTEDTLAVTSALTAGASSAKEPGRPQPLRKAIQSAWSRLCRRPGHVALDLDIQCADDLEVLIDKTALSQILINLLAEAMAVADPSTSAAISVEATVDNEMVQLEISTGASVEKCRGDTLELCVARVLLEMNDTSLLVISRPQQVWRAVTVLDRAVQADFFSSAASNAEGNSRAAA